MNLLNFTFLNGKLKISLLFGKEEIMTATILILAVLLDIFIGDPYSFPHPVKVMGNLITWEERLIRKRCRTKKALRFGGMVMVLINLILGYMIPFFLLWYSRGIWKTIFSVYLPYTCISGRMLQVEGYKVLKALNISLESGRRQVGNIVGRDTTQLTREEIITATVEAVAENTSDGIIAPLFYILILGIPGGILYKFVNTMDSMVGYRNEKYLDLGRYPAIVDDIFNFIPARITGYLFVIIGFFMGKGREAYTIMKRDHGNHLSPNAGFPEAAMAGILGIKLGGGHFYFGKFVDKPTIGDGVRSVREKDIITTVKCMFGVEFIFVVFMIFCYIL